VMKEYAGGFVAVLRDEVRWRSASESSAFPLRLTSRRRVKTSSNSQRRLGARHACKLIKWSMASTPDNGCDGKRLASASIGNLVGMHWGHIKQPLGKHDEIICNTLGTPKLKEMLSFLAPKKTGPLECMLPHHFGPGLMSRHEMCG
jgi:hypothetical protein